MIRKIYSRNVFVIEVSQADNVIGYYAGKDRSYSIVVKSLNDAMVIKTEKGIRHILTNLEINYGTDYSFNPQFTMMSTTMLDKSSPYLLLR